MDERSDNSINNEATTTVAPVAAPPAPPALGPLACGAGLLVGEAKNIAQGVASLATHFRGEQIPRWHTRLRRAGPYLLALSVVIGALFAMEQFLGYQQETERTRVDALFSAATEQLASPHTAIQAGAVRSLPRLGYFADVARSQPGDYFFGSHLIHRFVRPHNEYPLMQRSWMLFRDFAAQPRTRSVGDSSESDAVSSALLHEGAVWEKRLRMGKTMTDIEVSGSLLYKAKLANAQGIEGDYRGIIFGAVDLTNANLSGSKFDDCGLSGAHLDGANLRGASLESAYLAEAKMRKADFSFARLDDAIFKRALLQGATFTQTSMVQTDFTDATLDGVTFSQTTIRHALFNNASLRGAIFSQADVSSASFNEADVEGADFTAAIGFSNTTLSGARNAQKARLPSGYVTQRGKKLP
jgi:uncharacterized protein YjbI with pentapeptide repeats